MKKKVFNVLTWDFNSDKLEYYDVLPHFRDCYKERKKKSKGKRVQKLLAEMPYMKDYYGVPQTYKECRDFVENESRSLYWGNCNWEMIVHGWPVRKNDYKLDVHEQIMMNLDVIAGILWEEIEAQNERKKRKSEPKYDTKGTPFDKFYFPEEWPEKKD